ncbi:MAG: Gfo/Idh/MocA family oxidoreductase, partial [bacterium]
VMAEKLKVGVIGVGHLGEHHARILGSFHDVELVGVVDTDKNRGRQISEKYDTDFYSEIEELIPKIEAASVVVPTEYHFEVGKKLMEAGIDCLIEKPMVQTISEAEKLYKIAIDNDVLLQVGHIERFNTAFVAANEFIEAPRFIEVNRLGPFSERSTDIGVVMDLMIHDIDIMLSMVDSPIKEIRTVSASVVTDFEDICNARFEFKNGCVANLTASRISPEARREIRVFQEHNYVSLNYKDQEVKIWRLKDTVDSDSVDFEVYTPEIKDGESLRRELLHFVHCIQEGREPIVGGSEGKNALRVAFDVMDAMANDNIKKFHG